MNPEQLCLRNAGLARFSALEYLRIGVDLSTGPGSVLRLVDVLPPSLVKLTLVGPSALCWQFSRIMFDSFAERRAARLPNLQAIKFEFDDLYDYVEERVSAICEKCGVSVITSLAPQWFDRDIVGEY